MAQNPNNPVIPAEAKIVFKGERWSVWQWQQRMFDGSMATFEIPERADAVTAIAIHGDQIALLTQVQVLSPESFLSLPGGEMDPGETQEQAIERELLEEAGCRAGRLEFWKSYYPTNRLAYGFHYFIARDCTISSPPRPDSGERITVEWIPFEQLFTLAFDSRFRHSDLSRDLMDMIIHPEKKEAFRILLGL